MKLPSLTKEQLQDWFKRLMGEKELRNELMETYPQINSNYPRQGAYYMTLMAWKKSGSQ